MREPTWPLVTRLEVLDHTDGAFAHPPADRSSLARVARATNARDEVLTVIDRLPDTSWRRVADLAPLLAHLPAHP